MSAAVSPTLLNLSAAQTRLVQRLAPVVIRHRRFLEFNVTKSALAKDRADQQKIIAAKDAKAAYRDALTSCWADPTYTPPQPSGPPPPPPRNLRSLSCTS